MKKYESKSDLLFYLDFIKIFAIVATIPAYIILMSLITSVTLPVYVFTSESNKKSTR